MTPIRRLTDNIHLLNFKFTDTMQNNLYLIHDQNEAALIDAHIGTMAEQVLDTIQSLIPLATLKTVILTHGHMDHIGACHKIKERTEASIAIHIADAQYLQEPWTQFLTLYQDLGVTKESYEDFISLAGGEKGVRVSLPLQDGDKVKVGSLSLEIIHTPGHSPGSICIYEPKSKILFTGDALIPSEWYSSRIGIFQDAIKYIRSLEKISEMEVSKLCLGHERIREGSEVKLELKKHFDRYQDIEKNLLQILSESKGLTLWEVFYGMADRLLSPDNRVPGIASLVTLRAFLNKLSYEGKIVQVNGSTWRGIMHTSST